MSSVMTSNNGDIRLEEYFDTAMSLVAQFLKWPRGCCLEEVIHTEEYSVALVALTVAKNHFDPKRRTDFRTYATHKISGYLRHWRDSRRNRFHAAIPQVDECYLNDVGVVGDQVDDTRSHEIQAVMRVEIRKLPIPERTVMTLRAADLTIEQVAIELGMKLWCASEIQTRAMSMLRESLNCRFGDEFDDE